MDIGVVKESAADEHRVALTPFGVRQFVDKGHRVFVQTGAGLDARFEDSEYAEAGAQIVYQREETLRRSGVILGVRAPSLEDVGLLEAGQVVFAFHHLIVAPKELILKMQDRKITAIGYETIEDANGHPPILGAIGELAGQMVVHIAAHLLHQENGGRGVLLGAVPGINPTRVLVLGAGTVGRTAVRNLVLTGAKVRIMDRSEECLRRAREELPAAVEKYVANAGNVARFSAESAVIIGAVRMHGLRTPYLVTRKMVSAMRPGSVIIDVAIDQGGCVETSRPTTLTQPTFTVDNVVHYCVPALTASIPRTASKVLSREAFPYVAQVAREGIEKALTESEAIRKGTYIHKGEIQVPELAARLGK
ncbi:MAG: alanine dehydrogenase [Pseudomonadota bacterium]